MTSEGTPQDNWWRSAQKPSGTTFDCAIFLFAQPSLFGSIVTVSLTPPLSKRAQLREPMTFNSFSTRLYRLSAIADILQLTGN
jgi:hypothetical protein